MKTHIVLTGLFITLVAGMIACAPTPASAPLANPTVPPAERQVAIDPMAIAKAYVETANTGDLEKTLAFYADDAIVNVPIGLFIGKAEIARWLADDVKTTRAAPRDWKMQGALVVGTGTVSLDRFSKVGIGPVEYRDEYLIDQNGKIRYHGPLVTLTAEQQQKMREAQAGGAPAPMPGVNPIDVVKGYVDAANSGDLDKALAFYADDSGAFVVNSTLLLSGKTQVADWLKDDVKTTRATPQDWQANGNVVITTGTVSLERLKKLGVDPVKYRAQYIVENGKIRFFYPTLEFTPEQAAKIQAAQSPQAAPTR